jgi:GSH-dependent disulfide-bond oxidoreductase
LEKRQQKEDWYLRINPNGRTSAIVDDAATNCGLRIGSHSHLACSKNGAFIATDRRRRSDVMQRLMFQMAGVGPNQGQAHAFVHYFPERIPSVVSRFLNESHLYEILNNRLADRGFLCGDFSISDTATWPWVRIRDWPGIAELMDDAGPRLDQGRVVAAHRRLATPHSLPWVFRQIV